MNRTDIMQAAFEEQVNITLLAILEERLDLDEYFIRKDDESVNDYSDWG